MPHSRVVFGRSPLTPVPLPTFRWPSGIDSALAVLHAEPAELTAQYGIAFIRDLDDLDWHLVAVVRLPSGRPVMFKRYAGSPGLGTEVWIDRKDSVDAAWEELRSVVGIDESATSWRSELLRATPSAT